MLVPQVPLPAGALTICPACLQAKDEEFARRANASSQRALRESCYFEEKRNVVEPKSKKKASSKRQQVYLSVLLCLAKDPLQSKEFQRENLTLRSKEKEERKHQTPRTRPFKEGVSDHQAFHAKLDCTWLRQQSKAPTAAHA